MDVFDRDYKETLVESQSWQDLMVFFRRYIPEHVISEMIVPLLERTHRGAYTAALSKGLMHDGVPRGDK